MGQNKNVFFSTMRLSLQCVRKEVQAEQDSAQQ